MPVYQGQEYYTLPHVQMTPERIEQVSSIMRLGNLELKRLHQELLDANELGPKEYIRADFRKELFAWLASMNGQVSCRLKRRKGGKTYSPLLFVPSQTNNPYDTFTVVDGHRQPVQKARGVDVSSRAMRRILAVKAIQEEVLQGFSRLFERLAIRFWLNHKELSLGIQDYYNEGVAAAINAIYHYTRDDVEFITYVYHCVRRKMGRATVHDNPLSPWSNEARLLHRVYEEARVTINKPATFQEICDHCQFSDAEMRLVEMTLAEVVQAWDSAGPRDYQRRLADQYETNCLMVNGRRPIHHGRNNISLEDDELHLDLDQREAVERARARMSAFQNAVLDAYLNDGTWGWQSRVAEQNINPATGKSYSRAAPAAMWPRIVRMILEEYQEEEETESVKDVA